MKDGEGRGQVGTVCGVGMVCVVGTVCVGGTVCVVGTVCVWCDSMCLDGDVWGRVS